MRKRLALDKLLYFFLTGGVGTGKTFITKVLFQKMIRIYDKLLGSDSFKPKGIIDASTGKVVYNAGGVTAHSTFHLPCTSSKMLPLDAKKIS